ncbi:aminotransferase class I/II-fold pyridoxal phosphate-dependent enzyme [Collinsella sp. AGMB00827]|uniref:cysteine-S-conjugate beta-lyase n=1 Tax=Collinsella ureilytica TaxID=2869515 RepID=A0ABS7MII9_9ACTN|nr:aminotransferase class I/II-fold pyridoxal phosphate-dependent enzyme [Collinsella urealyticum]MBY4797102.1 aminotransferase class I/II-fold pyridoxal phosphate-dependent enzyme [Collinsella urealyticum]
MAFDFTSILDRSGKDSIATDGLGIAPGAPEPPASGFDAIPMWIADMSFPVAPCIIEAIQARLEHPCFGYFSPSEAYTQAIISWQRRQHGLLDLAPEHIGYENGVLGGVVSTVLAAAAPGDTVLIHSPTYIGFTRSLENAGFHIELSPLVKDEQGVFRMDFDDMEARLANTHAHVAVLCSPYNPIGRVWEREELERAMEIYARHDCIVVSDEIWSDVVRPGVVHIPTQQVSEDARRRTVALYAPNKSFNIAGLVSGYHIIYDEALRDRVVARSTKSHYNAMNMLSMHALIGAYSDEGAAWVAELNRVLAAHADRARAFFGEHAPTIDISAPQGTYMLWLDAGEWCKERGCSLDELLAAGWRVGVGWQDGRPFHGPSHIRMNLALPEARLEEALHRLADHVFDV